ncbi:13238_t:CDS:2 [Entrophospora sp. SA101]|nr:7667_t:CDS:2 [Entrophospora sp. SA101]CAJ0842581.1 13238_t:CDS:2 [Entrophospora sp. SA101]
MIKNCNNDNSKYSLRTRNLDQIRPYTIERRKAAAQGIPVYVDEIARKIQNKDCYVLEDIDREFVVEDKKKLDDADESSKFDISLDEVSSSGEELHSSDDDDEEENCNYTSSDDISDLAEFIDNIKKSSGISMNNNHANKRNHMNNSNKRKSVSPSTPNKPKYVSQPRNVTATTNLGSLNNSIIQRIHNSSPPPPPSRKPDFDWILDDDDSELFSRNLINIKKDTKKHERCIFKSIDNLQNKEDINLENNIVKKCLKNIHTINKKKLNGGGEFSTLANHKKLEPSLTLPLEIEESLKELCRIAELTPEVHLEKLIELFEKLYLEIDVNRDWPLQSKILMSRISRMIKTWELNGIEKIENSSKLIGRVFYFLTELFKNIPKDVFLIKNFVEVQYTLIDKIYNVLIKNQQKQNYNNNYLLKIILPDLLPELEKLLDYLILKKSIIYYTTSQKFLLKMVSSILLLIEKKSMSSIQGLLKNLLQVYYKIVTFLNISPENKGSILQIIQWIKHNGNLD